MKARLKIKGMHCVSCAMSIDGLLEDLTGVKTASTNYAKSQTEVEYDEKKVNLGKIKQLIKSAGYELDSVGFTII